MIVGVWRDFVIDDRKFSGSRIFVGVTVISIKSTMIIARGVFVEMEFSISLWVVCIARFVSVQIEVLIKVGAFLEGMSVFAAERTGGGI